MSTEHQQYSIVNQSAAIREYALVHGFEITHSYCDRGRSGLTIRGRPALAQLLTDVEHGAANFRAILVYDISRWGRFQNADESAYYEYICRRSGIPVHYCAERFQDDRHPLMALMKVLKRTMAAEFSRDLSTRVFAAQSRLVKLGYHQGGRAGIGLRREVRDQAGAAKLVMQTGEWKYNPGERTVLVPGPPEEIEVVRLIFHLFATRAVTAMQIACALNKERYPTNTGGVWSAQLVRRILTNERYVGVNVWNAISYKLKGRRTKNEPGKVIRVEGALEPIVTRKAFDIARAAIGRRDAERAEEAMLERLKALGRKHGYVTFTRVAEAVGKAEAARYAKVFGSLATAAEAAGVSFGKEESSGQLNRELRKTRTAVIAATVAAIRKGGGSTVWDGRFLRVNGTFTVAIVIMRSFHSPAKGIQWRRFVRADRAADLIVAARQGPNGKSVQDFCILPGEEIVGDVLRLSRCRDRVTACYRFDDLAALFDLSKRTGEERAS